VKGSNSSKAVFNAIKFHQGHSLVHRLFQDMDILNLAVFAENIKESLFVAYISFERRDVKSVRRRVDGDRLFFSESK